MKKTKILISTILLGLFFITACDKDFEELNKNPNDATEVSSGLITADVVRNLGNSLYSTFWGGDMGSCWSQQWAKVNYEEEARYKPRESVIEGTIWKRLYEDVISDAHIMEQLAIAEGNSNMQGVALVMQAYTYSILTETFGMIPFSEAMQSAEGNFTPVYDSQQDVYNGIFAMLDKADGLFSATGGTITAASDILYGGDYTGWQKFANTLKFRLKMRISHKVDVSTDLQDILDNKSVFTSNSDEAKLIYLSAAPNANPIYESLVLGARFEYKVNKVLVDMLVNLNDPRLAVYAEKNGDGEYRGKPSGIDNVPSTDWNYENVSAVGDLYTQPETPAIFMSYSEFMFLKAEAALKGYITGNAQTFYENGVAASFTTNEISSSYAAYITQATVATATLQNVAEQNWLGLYCQGIESWTEWRRTGYPVLVIAIEAVEPEIPSRLSYPEIELSVNKTSCEAAISAQGGDNLTTKFWWLK
ncbi:MAG: SusD/RagB family nutrient-binding outer membrane lipoprotein [Bacteroidales bacterium]|nr:SusD/RagB family nutrient-binding outer membrane lipoprotein [Bacteroidales bacterium]